MLILQATRVLIGFVIRFKTKHVSTEQSKIGNNNSDCGLEKLISGVEGLFQAASEGSAIYFERLYKIGTCSLNMSQFVKRKQNQQETPVNILNTIYCRLGVDFKALYYRRADMNTIIIGILHNTRLLSSNIYLRPTFYILLS